MILPDEQVVCDRKNIANLVRFRCPLCEQEFKDMDGKPWHISYDGRFEINCYPCGVHISGKLTLTEVQVVNDPEPFKPSWGKPEFPEWSPP